MKITKYLRVTKKIPVHSQGKEYNLNVTMMRDNE